MHNDISLSYCLIVEKNLPLLRERLQRKIQVSDASRQRKRVESKRVIWKHALGPTKQHRNNNKKREKDREEREKQEARVRREAKAEAGAMMR